MDIIKAEMEIARLKSALEDMQTNMYLYQNTVGLALELVIKLGFLEFKYTGTTVQLLSLKCIIGEISSLIF